MQKLIPILFSFMAWMAIAPQIQAELLAVGDVMETYTLPDQFDKEHTLDASTRAVLISSEKKVSQAINAWLASKGEDYLTEKKLEYVSDISPMPAPITKLFALPKMKKQKFPIILNRDDNFKDRYPRQDKKMVLFLLDEKHQITAIEYIAKPEEIETFLP